MSDSGYAAPMSVNVINLGNASKEDFDLVFSISAPKYGIEKSLLIKHSAAMKKSGS